MVFKIIILTIIFICKACAVKNILLPPVAYLLDDKLDQSLAFVPLDGKENELKFEMADLLSYTEEHPRRIKKKHLSLKTAASKFLLELYDTLNEEENQHLTNHPTRTKRSTLITKEDRIEIEKCNNVITFSSKQRSLLPNSRNMIITFNTNPVPRDFQLIRAELRVFQDYKPGRQFEGGQNVTISIFRKVLNSKLQNFDLELVHRITTTSNYKGWLEVNVTNIMAKWLSKGYTQNGHDLIISSILGGSSNDAIPEENQPFIVGYFNGQESELMNKIQHMRLKRDTARQKRYGAEYNVPQSGVGEESYMLPKTCERLNFSVDFKDLQMQDWVIAPKKFEAYFCGGGCNFPLGSNMNATNHAIVQTLMHLKQPNLPKPCCVPTVLESLSILHHLSEDSVNLSRYPNTVVKSCGCH